jgi:hypothetical protein
LLGRVEDKVGYRIIKRGEASVDVAPLDCLLCKSVLIDEMDEISIVRSGCCFDCESEIVDPNRPKWILGWRPDQTVICEIRSRRLSSPHSRVHI